MSNTPIGIVAEQTAKREALVGRLSPAARHAAFPKIYSRPPAPEAPPEPEPAPDLAELVRAAVERYMGSPSAKKVLERAVTSALSEEAIRWRNRRLAMQVVAENAARYSIDQVLEIASQITGVSVDGLQAVDRRRHVAWPRHFAMTLLHVARRDLSTSQIGKVFGRRDHTTVLHALNVSLVRRTYPECEGWYADPRAVAILAGSEYSAETDRSGGS
jgi:hypothetical protein